MAKRFKAAVIGGSGYGGGEIIRRLLLHPYVELARVASVDLIGEPIWAAHPQLEGVTDLRFEREIAHRPPRLAAPLNETMPAGSRTRTPARLAPRRPWRARPPQEPLEKREATALP